jgi:hypothetical protein
MAVKKTTTGVGPREYKLCCAHGPGYLSDEVTGLLSDGWQLYAQPFMVVYPDNPNDSTDQGRAGAMYCQAVTR